MCVCVREREGEMLFNLTKHRDYFLASFQSVTNKQNIYTGLLEKSFANIQSPFSLRSCGSLRVDFQNKEAETCDLTM